MKHQLTTLLFAAVCGTAAAQLQSQEHYLKIDNARDWSIDTKDDGSFDLLMMLEQGYRFDTHGKLIGQGKIPLIPKTVRGGDVNVTDPKTGTMYCLAPTKTVVQWNYGRVLLRDAEGKEQTVNYDDPDAKQFNKPDFVGGSRWGYAKENGDIVFLVSNGGASALGTPEVKGKFSNYLKRYVYHPATGTMEQSVHLLNKIPIPATKASQEYVVGYAHGKILGIADNKLYVVYDYTEDKKAGKRTVDVWSVDLETLAEKLELSEVVNATGEYLTRDTDAAPGRFESGMVYTIGSYEPDGNARKATYAVFGIFPGQEVQRIDLEIPAEMLTEEKSGYPPSLTYYMGAKHINFFTTLGDDEKESLAIMTYEKSSGSVDVRLETGTSGLHGGSCALFFDAGMDDMIEAYREELPYAGQQEACGNCVKKKAGCYFVDAENVAHLVIVEHLEEPQGACTNCATKIRHAHVRILRKELE